ncbi:hypothetical protein ABH937_004231 [Kitasatospora sp. GAS1066B]
MFLCAAGITVAAFVLSFFLKQVALRRPGADCAPSTGE